MGDVFKVGIIGCGLIGKKRAKVIAEDPKCRLCCAADIRVQHASVLGEFADNKFKAYRDWRDMLEKESLDIIIVSTPNKFLKEIVLGVAQRNIHILCEKPLGRNVWESEMMVKVARGNGVVLKTGFNHRYHPAVFKANFLIANGAIGPVYLIRCVYGHGGRPGYEKEWRASRELSGGGELLDQGVHVVDLFRWFMGDFDEAFGYLSTFYWNMEVEDNAFACFKTVDGRIATMHTSWTQWKNKFTFEVFGESGYVIVDGLGGSYGVERLTIGARRKMLKGRSKSKVVKHTGGVPDEETIVFDGQDVSWKYEWQEFIAAIRKKREPMGNGFDGLEANRMIAAVYRSAQENRPVKIAQNNKGG